MQKQNCLSVVLDVKAFTLIELLVVVLIIGILAAVALPQYEKAVEKSKSAQALTMLKTVYNAANAYYLANGTHATSFDELSVDIPWTGTQRWTSVGSAPKSNSEWSIQLYNSSDLKEPGISVGRLRGKYKGAGFIIYLPAAQHGLPKETPLCMERSASGDGSGTSFSGADGEYCQKIMKGTLRLDAQGLRWYVLP